MMLVEEGKLQLTDPVAKYLPALRRTARSASRRPGRRGKPTLEIVAAQRAMTVQDLLRHTSGLTYGFFGNALVKKIYANRASTPNRQHASGVADGSPSCRWLYQPGTTWDYSHSTDVLGAVVEVVSGQTL